MSDCKRNLGAQAIVLAVLIFAPSAFGQTEARDSRQPQFEWTKIQDLQPQARATNRPIKDKWAVVIGIGEFQEKPLNNELRMDKAAQQFYDYLIDAKFGRFDKDHVKLLTNAEATRQSILSAVGQSWLGLVAGPDDLVVVFVGTHGFPAGDGNTYICASNTVLDNVYATGISMQGLMQTLRQNVKSDRIVLVLQACYSGAAELTSGAKALFKNFNIDLDKLILGKGYMILSSSRPDQITWGDLFSANLIKALKKQDGLVPLKQAFAEAQERTEHDTTHECEGCKPQIPVIKSDWTGNDIIIGTPSISKVKDIPPGAVNFLAAEAHYLAATKFVSQRQMDSAIEELRAAIGTDPNYADAYGDYGAILALRGNWEASAKQLEKAIQIKPDDGLFRSNYARVLLKLGRPDESRQVLEAAYKLNPKDRVVLTALSDAAGKTKDWAMSAKYLQEALTLYPGSAKLHDRLSFVLTQQNKTDEALTHAREAVKLDAHSVTSRINLGSILLMQGDVSAAVDSYRSATKLAPENMDAHYLLGCALDKAQDVSGARAELTRFVELAPSGDPRRGEVQKKLAELSVR